MRFGNNDVPEPDEDIKHRVSVAIADPRGQSAIERYFDDAKYPGFTTLPEGVHLRPEYREVIRERPSDQLPPQ